ncbi:sensor histidine kinase [Altericista sp. CCNU0014]|uniref:sensor histidine kinase n=1 Tax=Altericista sp. CCNU0014 TaxID=3082949 RepID=UPI00384C6508
MPRPNDPFALLIYLEWFLLSIVALLELLMPAPFLLLDRRPLLVLISIAGFGAMGLKLPQADNSRKVLFTLLEIALILVASFGGGSRLFAFCYLILVIRSCLIFPLLGQWIVALSSFGLYVLTQIYFVRHWALPVGLSGRLWSSLWGILVSFTLLYGLSLGFVLLLTNAILSERQSLKKLAIANEQLRRYALRIEDQATLQERNRIAREIHDSLGHSLTGLNIQLETALKLIAADPAKAQSFLASAKQLGSSALQEVRTSVSLLRATPLQGDALHAALADLVQTFHRTTGILPSVCLELPASLPAELSATIYRIVQESLTNICKYGNAKTVTIRAEVDVRDLTLTVRDDGQGFDVMQNTTGFGIQGMRERTLALKGRFQVSSQPGAGCCIAATFPLSDIAS